MSENFCESETLTVEVEGEPGGHYGDLLATAMLKAEERLPGALVHRAESECGGAGGLDRSREEWFLGCGHAHLAPVGLKLEGHFTFVRRR